ncbi:polyadenylation and cleavage factor homolog 4-like isoform X2 [Solanum dulcamara]|uniref:polyadenylation and cleavage factor homolog 4-like isoform X2 n=1 Tax=Solanum dulcamara TaxID=45834 RepID=UPI002486853C|nr:polyadenylation and cleavage factor homolog 4-like isoform X2 [Solanum dulcamara]
MKSSRRSCLEPGIKKPRLTEDPIGTNRSSNGGSFVPQREANSGSIASRFRVIDSWEDPEDSDSLRGPYQQQQVQLISEYKRALAELTINSKPIITNLTIIAGENLRDAKAIAAIICGNILEIPSEQKLPSLYLLDSIVKNIGRDYIKYFAARLPEVFCKAYRQVEPSVHSGMQRLFVTWRKVFPPPQLQLIEKELGFTTGVNGSSSGTRRDDSKAQQTAHSIHVNPKYLEARQCLQQPTRAKGSADDITPGDIQKPERAASLGSGRSWVDMSTKCVQKEQLNERIREKTTSAAYGDPEYVSDLSRGSGFGLRITGEKLKEEQCDKSWYNSANGKILSQRNGLDLKHGVQSLSQNTANSDAYPQPTHSLANRSSTLMDRSWQSSDEEEYMWDDANSADKDQRASEDSYKSGLDNQHPRPQSMFRLKAESEASVDSLSREDKGQASSENQMSSMWSDEARHLASVRSTPDHPRGYLTSFSGLSVATNSIAGKSFQSQKGSSHVGTPSLGIAKTANGSRRPMMQPREIQGAAPPSLESAMRHLPPSPSILTGNFNQVANSLTTEYHTQTESHADPRMSQFSRRSNLDPRNQVSQDTLPMTSQSAHLVSSQISQTPRYNPSSLMSSLQEEHHVPFPQKIQQESPESEFSIHTQKSIVTQLSGLADHSGTVPSILPGFESSGQTSMSSLLAAVMKSGVLGSSSSVGTPLNSRDKGPLSSEAGAQPPLPSGPPIHFLSSGPKTSPSVASAQLDRNASNPPNYSQRNGEQPRLPPDPAPALVDSESLQAPNVVNSASNPVARLLSSLVAKGLISASKEESPTSTPPPTPPQTRFQSPPASISSTPGVYAPVFSPAFSSPKDELSLSKPAAKIHDALPQSNKEEREVAFKPGVIRESNPGVISELLDDVPHQCGICGLRLKLQVRLDRHLEWHALRNPDGKLLHGERRWYLNSGEWIAGTGSVPHCGILAGPTGVSSKLSECTEVMVPADEGQCICFLCGQFFEDSYDEESDKWMFKGAVYMNNSSNESGIQNPIVHKNCISESSQNGMLKYDIKLELKA